MELELDIETSKEENLGGETFNPDAIGTLKPIAVNVCTIEIFEHNNADALEIGKIDDYQVVVKKNEFKSGDIVVYIPEQSIVPEKIISALGLEGRLAGPEHNRLKAVKLRGVLSQGLVYRPLNWPADWKLGNDVSEELGIYKWEPPIPPHLAGDVERAPAHSYYSTYTDIENIKKYPDVIEDGELVVMSEKLHGSCTIVGIVGGQSVVSSKGIAAQGLMLKQNAGNAYWRAAEGLGLFDKIERYLEYVGSKNALLFGELLGVQDLKYGLRPGELGYAAFDLKIDGEYVNSADFYKFCDDYGVRYTPVLYEGPFSKEKLTEFTSGPSEWKNADHIREGLVVRPVRERENLEVGRVILKSLSEQYLLRKNPTEYN